MTREKIWHPGAVGIIPVDDTHVWLTRQPREVVGASASLEIPAGKLDVPGEPPLATAKRELAEEIGKQASSWEEVLVLPHEPGLHATSGCGCTSPPVCRTRPRRADEDERIEIVPWPLSKLDAAIAECEDSKSLIALLWLAGAGTLTEERTGATANSALWRRSKPVPAPDG